MSQGGAQGLEFGPFPQDFPRFKQRTTGRQVTGSGPDPELVWNRNKSLVEGWYQVQGRFLVTDLSGSLNGIEWIWDIPDESNAIVNIDVVQNDFLNSTTLAPAIWSGDGAARYSTIIPLNAQVGAELNGVIFVPEPGNVQLTWSPTTGDAEVNAGTLVRLRLMRQ